MVVLSTLAGVLCVWILRVVASPLCKMNLYSCVVEIKMKDLLEDLQIISSRSSEYSTAEVGRSRKDL